ncbi:hypothetical protein Tco_1431417, partial [Tanacetum coccineum]
APFLNVQKTFEHSSSSLGHQCQSSTMMSDHNSSDLAPQRQWRLLKITLQAPFLNVQMTFEHSSSSLGHQCLMMSDHNSSDLAPQRQWCLLKITLQAPFLNVQKTFEQCSSSLVLHQMTSDHNRSELGIQDHSNEQSSSKLVSKVVP